MVLAGFQAQAVIEQIINKLEDAQQQNKDFASAAEVAQQLVTQLNQWSTLAQQHIVQGKQEVTLRFLPSPSHSKSAALSWCWRFWRCGLACAVG